MEKYSNSIAKELEKIRALIIKNTNKKLSIPLSGAKNIKPNLIFNFEIEHNVNERPYQARGNMLAYAIAYQQISAEMLTYLLNYPGLEYDTTFEILTNDNKTYEYHPIAYCLTYQRYDLLTVFFETPNINWANIKMPVNHQITGATMYIPIIFNFIHSDLDIFKKALAKFKDISFFAKDKTKHLLIEIINKYRHNEELCLQYLKVALSNFKQPAQLINVKAEAIDPLSETLKEIAPLLYATELGLTKVVDLFISQSNIKLDISSTFINLATAAVHANNLNVFRHLHEKNYIKPKKIGRALHVACLFGHYDLVNFMLEHNYHHFAPNQVGIELKKDYELRNGLMLYAETPLQIAIMQGHLNIANLLLEKGKVSIDEIDGLNKRSAIFIAIEPRTLTKSALSLMQETEESTEEEQSSNNSLSSSQETYEQTAPLDWCLQQGADLNLVDNNGMTPLLFAIHCNVTDASKKLIAAGANLNTTDDFHQTPLIMAVRKSNYEIVTELCSKPTCDLYACDSHGLTAFHYALSPSHLNSLKILINNITKPKKKKKILLDLINILENFSKKNQNLIFLKDELTKLTPHVITNSKNSPSFFSAKPLEQQKFKPLELLEEPAALQKLLVHPTWFNHALTVIDERHLLKLIRKTVNGYLYLPEELIRQQATQQNYTNTEKLDHLLQEPYPKFLHALNDKTNYSIQVEIENFRFTTQLSQEIYVDSKARILVFAIPEEYKDDKSQRGTLYMGIFSKSGLHDQGDVNNLLASNKIIKIFLPKLSTPENKEEKPISPIEKKFYSMN